MAPTIVLHLGPPKTATTSLQVALDTVESDLLAYVGTAHPRARNEDSLCHRIYEACVHGDHGAFSQLRDALVKAGSRAKAVVLSEEMFLVEHDYASVDYKLENLRNLLTGVECRILLSVRRAGDVLPSYYQEIFDDLPVYQQLGFAAFCRDSRVGCYDYDTLCRRLADFGFRDVRLIDFDYLADGRVDIGHLTGIADLDGVALDLRHHNAGQPGATAAQRQLPKVSLKRIGRIGFVNRLATRARLNRWPGYQVVTGLLDWMSLRRSGARRLTVPQDVLKCLDASYDAARDRYGFVQAPTREVAK